MFIPYSWLKDFVPLKKTPEQVAADLTAAVTGVEGIEVKGGEKVLDLEVTYNRGDLLSVIGVARELATLYQLELKGVETEWKPPTALGKLAVSASENLAKTYTLTKLIGLSYQQTPDPIRRRLEQAGLRPANLWADLTNYVMLEYGQPLHAFDVEKVARQDPTLTIEVRNAHDGETLKTLDGNDHRLTKSDLVIASKAGPIALAGVMGGAETEVDEGTKEILLEAAIFDPTSIRRTSRRLGLRTEAGQRFEHYLSPENLYRALGRALALFEKYGKAQVSDFGAVGKEKTDAVSIVLTNEKLSALAGEPIPLPRAREYLERLGFKVMSSEKGLLCWPPDFRGDIRLPEDLVEEVLRLYGYEEIPGKPLTTVLEGSAENPLEETRHRAVCLLADLGFHEVKTYPFLSTAALEHLNLKDLLRLRNPLSPETEYLRPTLLFSLLEAARKNLPLQEGRIFELEKVYPKEGEVLKLGALAWGGKDPYLVLKGALESLEDSLKVELEIRRRKSDFLHPNAAVEILVAGKPLGNLGLVHPHLTESFGLPQSAFFELDLETLAPHASRWGTYVPVSPHPEVFEEFSFLLPENRELGRLMAEIQKASPLVREVELTDRFLREGQRSLTLRVTFQSAEKTLAANEIKPIRERIHKLIKRSGGTLRG